MSHKHSAIPAFKEDFNQCETSTNAVAGADKIGRTITQ